MTATALERAFINECVEADGTPRGLHCHLFDVAAQEETILSVPWDALPTLEGFVRIADGIALDAQ